MKKLLVLALLPALVIAEGIEVNPIITPNIAVDCVAPTETVSGEALSIALHTFYSSTDKVNWVAAGTNTTGCTQEYNLTDVPNGQYFYTSDVTDGNGLRSIKGVDGDPSQYAALVVKRPGTSVDLQGTPPEEGTISVTIVKPATASKVRLTLNVYDADFPDEGELIVNGNAPVPLFGTFGVGANDQKDVTITVDTSPDFWVDGVNTLLFRHTRTGGFIIRSVSVVVDTAEETQIPAPINVRVIQK